jgi:hypothetical protein
MPARVLILVAPRERLSTGRADRAAPIAHRYGLNGPADVAARSAELIVRVVNRATRLLLVPHDQRG